MIKPFYLDLTEKEVANIQSKTGEILRSGNLILGKYTKEFEDRFAEYIGAKYAVTLNTCTSALEVLFVLKKTRGKKVAVQTNTNFATVAAIIRAGGIPVFMDMDPDYFVPNLDILKYTVDKHPEISGVAWVHIGGIIHPEFQEVSEYCKSNNLFLIEDCAESLGSKYKSKLYGLSGDCSSYSFFPNKTITTGEGGMVIFKKKKTL